MIGRTGIDRLYSVTVPAGATTFTITLQGIGAHTFAGGASAQAVEDALQALLFPDAESCGQNGDSDCARSVVVQRFGTDYLIGFRGERNGLARTEGPLTFAGGPVLTATGMGGAALDVRRIDGINYYGLETLDIALGQGDDVFNVQGTLPVTNVSLNGGNERVYVSHLADVGIDARPDYLHGHLDRVAGTLNLDFGAGRHTLMISDEMATAGDGNVLITDVQAAALARDPRLAANAEIWIAGLAQGAISFRTSGNFLDGISIWTGSGNDTIKIDGTRVSGAGREITSLNTGLGDDTVTVDLDTGEDGFFVLNSQGAYDNRLHLAIDLGLGDLPLPADAVRVYRNGQLIDPSRYVVDYASDTIGLFDSYGIGDTITVQVTRFALAQAVGNGITTAYAVGGTRATAYVNGVAAGQFAAGVYTFATAPATGAYVTFHVETDAAAESFTVPATTLDSDKDIVHGEGSTLPLVIFGGQDDDQLHGGTGGDLIFGDRGRVLYFDPATGVPAAGADLEAFAKTVLGHGGPGDKISDGRALAVSFLASADTTVGGADMISTGLGGRDLVVGGADGDTITTNRGESAPTDADGDAIVIGDNGLVDFATVDADPADLDRIWVTDPDTGGSDTITTGAGHDVVIAGEDGELISEGTGKVRASAQVTTAVAPSGDTVFAGAGNDIVLGDDGRVTYFNTATVTSGIQRIETTDLNIGGPDVIGGGRGQDILIGGGWSDDVDGDADDDLIFGDQVVLDRRPGVITNPRFQLLIAGRVYSRSDLDTVLTQIADNSGQLLIQNLAQNYVDRSVLPYWVEFEIKELWHSLDIQAGSGGVAGPDSFAGDYIAGGGGDDVIFGQLGADVIQGDGDIETRPDGVKVGVSRTLLTGVPYLDPIGALVIHGSFEAATDGDDYIEAGGGADTVFGGLGQDDIIGGSSALFTLDLATERPDAGDYLFGGAGTQTARAAGAPPVAHGRDSDAIVGDNGNIHRLVSASGALLSFNYDDAYGEQLVVRGIALLDYMPGGPDFRPDCYGVPGAPAPLANQPACAVDDAMHGGDDEVHGESGDDWIYAGRGNDRLFGDGDDDEIVGGWGHDWISGGAGDDGVLGDDGRIFTSRNGLTEPLNGLTTANAQTDIASPGSAQTATLFPAGRLNRAFDITPFNLRPNGAGADDPLFDPAFADDVIFGGLGDDFLHGGSGDDAISGAEALAQSYVGGYNTGGVLIGLVRSDFTRPWNAGHILHFDDATNNNGRAGQFPYYDEYDPLRAIMLQNDGTLAKNGSDKLFLLNWAAGDGPLVGAGTDTRNSDGDDIIFGDVGNDWLVGGTGKDTMWGGWGNDMLDADDNKLLSPDGSNTTTDTSASYVDRAYGGAGLDILIGNTGADRLIDWVGEFDSYAVPFNPFGLGTVSRQLAPGLKEFLYALSRAQGADPTRTVEAGGDPLRNGEPQGEIGLIVQADPEWQDQTGGPRDPQGPIDGGGPKDIRSSADFNDASMQAFAPDSGTWSVQSGTLSATALTPTSDAAVVYYHDTYLPTYYEIAAQIRAEKPIAGWNANAYVIFDYHSPTNFKFAGINVSTNKYEMGYRDASGWHVVRQSSVQIKPETYYNMVVAVNGTAVTVMVNGQPAFEYVFPPQVVDGKPVPLNKGLIGLGSQGARGTFDNVAVQVLKPQMTLDETETFEDGIAQRFTLPGSTTGVWTVAGGRLSTTAPAAPASIDLMDFGQRINVNNYLELTARLRTTGSAGLVFDHYSGTEYKFVALDVAGQRLLIGHSSSSGAWVVDHAIARTLVAGQDYDLQLVMRGAAVSVSINGAFVVSWGFSAALVDGRFGAIARGGTAALDMVQVRTNDEAFAGTTPPPPGVPSVSIGDASAPEGAAGTTRAVTLILTLSAATTTPVSVAWATAAATAMAGSDYVHATGTATFAAGQTSATITVTVLGDAAVEGLEGFTVVLSNPQGVTIADGTGNVAIVDDDTAPPPPPAPSIAVLDVSVTEGDRNTLNVTVTLRLSAASSTPITVAFATQVAGVGSAFAVAGSDFQSKTGTVTFAAGQTTATVTIAIVGDRTAEPTETFNVVLSNATGGATIADGTAVVTILDNDGARLLASSTAAAGAAPAPALTVAKARKLLRRAISLWVRLGVKRSKLAGMSIRIVDLPGAELARASGRRILIDVDAAGWGWFAGAGERVAAARIDLLSVLAHELGHVLGLHHAVAGVMADTLAPGVRIRPSRAALRDRAA
ncbi:MAG TPA: Calx-beta domain-containing protein [Solirubrobacteraceae bacterium]|nr:Calx-beta domain-containing protein [Solirubrobacteraceae bacterium]